MNHQPHLDGWRGLAISAVLAQHFLNLPGDFGRFGVDLFFVLSGLLMSRILYEDRVSLGTFYRRRLSRVFPAFLLFVAVIFAVYPWQGWQEFFGVLTFTRSYMEPWIWNSGYPIGHLWSLAVEEHSYVLLATLAAIPFLVNREGLVLIGAGLATFGAIAAYMLLSDDPNQTWALRTECAAACLLLSAGYRRIAGSVPPWTPVVALLAAAVCYAPGIPAAAKVGIAPFLLAFSVNHIGQSYGWVVRALSARAMCMIGIWSYSLYLWQQPFYKLTRDGFPVWLGFVLTFAVALLSFYAVESPVRSYLNRRWRSSRAPVTACLKAA